MEAKVFVQPPYQVQVGTVLYPPVVVVMTIPSSMSECQFLATGHLVQTQGEAIVEYGLQGTIVVRGSTGRSRTEGMHTCLFAWHDLTVTLSGSFALRIHIYEVSHNGATYIAGATSRRTTVVEEPVSRQPLLPEERQALEIAKSQGALSPSFDMTGL